MAEEELGRPITDEEIMRRLRDSGMTPRDVRREMERRGLDPEAASPWLEVLEGRAESVPPGSDRVQLLQVMGEREAEAERPRPEPGADLLSDRGPPIFGRELFRRATGEFDAVRAGPVPPDYRVGPGDELILVLTGDVELAYELTVNREGWVVMPDVGRIMVQGRTIDDLREVFRQRLSQRFSGIRRGTDATTFFDITMGRLRTNEVFVIGDVERPSAYTVSALGTVLTALYQAGGPSRSGSFREIHLNRGGETVARIDLYDYLTRGRADGDIRLQHGDVLFVPVAERRVEVSGSVVRPGIYEMRSGEDLRDLLRYAGGVAPQAELRRVQIQRVLPLEERAIGRDRAVLDVSVGGLDDPEAQRIPVKEGDRVTVFAVLDDVGNEVRVSGGVWRPGTYAVGEDTRLWEVIERAGGLLPDVVQGRAQIQRVQPDWTRRLIPVSLARRDGGDPLQNPRIEGRDEIFVYAARNLREDRQVSIGGWVREPGIYPFSEGMTVADLILRAGGLRTGAYLEDAEISRVVVAQERTDRLTESLKVPLDSALVFDRSRPGGAVNPTSDFSRIEAGRFELENMDALYVRKAPGFDPKERVVVTGEVLFPGPYSISSRGERLSELIERAGGLTSEAYPEGFQLWRARDETVEVADDPARERARLAGLADLNPETGDRPRSESEVDRLRELERRPDLERAGAADRARAGTRQPPRARVGIDLAGVLRNPDSPDNILVHPNDSIHVPGFIPTVDVRGAVAAPTKVLFRPGAGLNYYIRQAGGYLEDADERRVRIQFANGEVATRGRRVLFIGGGIDRPDPGSVVTVPVEDPRETIQFREAVGIMTSTATAIAALIVAFSRF